MKLSELRSMIDMIEQEYGSDIEVFIFDFYRGHEMIDGYAVHKAKSNIYAWDSKKCTVEKGKDFIVLG